MTMEDGYQAKDFAVLVLIILAVLVITFRIPQLRTWLQGAAS